MYSPHNWSEKKRILSIEIPSNCTWCKVPIIPGRSFHSCSECNKTIHSRCIDNATPFCTQPSLLERGRKFIQEFTKLKYKKLNDSKMLNLKKQTNLILFNDSLFFYYGSKENAKIASMIRWYSTTTGKDIEIDSSSVDNKLIIKAPRTFEKHMIECHSNDEKQFILSSIENAIHDWKIEQKNNVFIKNKSIKRSSIPLSEKQVDNNVNFKIIKYDKILSSEAKSITTFTIEVKEPNNTTYIVKQYNDFITFHTFLRSRYGSKKLPKLPSKYHISGYSYDDVTFNQLRSRILEQYLTDILSLNGIFDLPVFTDFIRSTFCNDSNPNLSSNDIFGINHDNHHDDDNLSDISISDDEDEDGDDTNSGESTTHGSFGQVLFDFQEDNNRDFLVSSNEIVEILNDDNVDWWYCRYRGKIGYLPANYVSKLK